jgi:hypothetical protein
VDNSESPTPRKGEKRARQSSQRGPRRQFVGYEKETEAEIAVLAARMLTRGTLLVGLVLMQVRKGVTVMVRMKWMVTE